jgi:CubicO group peptidase (beta-lactamase class C family)
MKNTTALSLSELLEHFIKEDGFSGAAVMVQKKNKTVFEDYAGMAAPGLPSSATVLWPIASISKMFAVAAMMRLVEMGHLTLNTRVSQVSPEFTGGGREDIRLRHLLTHTSGMIYESPDMLEKLKAQTPLEDLTKEAYNHPLLFKPGTSLSYADYNTLIAGHMAEVAMQTSLPELVKTLVTQPMGLEDTFFPTPSEQDHRVAYVRGPLAEGTPGAMYNSRYARGLAHPAFAVMSTLSDLMRFTAHFAPGGPRIHTELTVRAMTSDQTGCVTGSHPALSGLPEPTRVAWGLGFMLQTPHLPSLFSDFASAHSFGHGGASGCMIVVDPEHDLCIVILSNAHLNLGRDMWFRRLQLLINASFVQFGSFGAITGKIGF